MYPHVKDFKGLVTSTTYIKYDTKALAFPVQQTFLARLKFQTVLPNYGMTDRTKTIHPPIFDLVGETKVLTLTISQLYDDLVQTLTLQMKVTYGLLGKWKEYTGALTLVCPCPTGANISIR